MKCTPHLCPHLAFLFNNAIIFSACRVVQQLSQSILECLPLCALCCVWLFVTPWTVACQASQSMGFLQARILVAISFPRDLLDPGIKPMSPVYPALAGRLSTTEPLGKPPKVLFSPPKCSPTETHSLFQPSSPFPCPGNHYMPSLFGLVWTFQTQEIIPYVVFCNWFLSLSMFSNFTHAVMHVNASFLFVAK